MRKFLKAIVWIAGSIAVVVGLLRLTVLRWGRIPFDDQVLGASVTPTLRAGDLVILWRASAPAFGELVVCPDPTTEGRIVIGRIVGEPGDTVRIEEGRLYLNDRAAETESACGTFAVEDPITGNVVDQPCWIEALGGVSHQRGNVFVRSGRPVLRTTRKVSEGNVFLLSDNRQYPYDSRDYGAVPRATCKERVAFRLWSRDGF